MNSALLNALSLALLPIAAAIVGASFAVFRPPGSFARSYFQYLAGFATGVLLMLVIRRFTHGFEDWGSESSVGLLVAVGVDVLLDGLLTGISFAAGAKARRLLTFALTIELLPQGLAVAVARSGKSRLKLIATITLLSRLIVSARRLAELF